MRIPSFPTLLRTFNAVSNFTTYRIGGGLIRGGRPVAYRSMPSIPFIGSFFGSSANTMAVKDYNVKKSEGEWQAILSPEQFRIIRQKGTEMAGTGKYDKHYPKEGVYNCAACDSPLYKATTKFNSGCGWPAFFDAVPGAVDQHDDTSGGMRRTEITCSNCGGHLGHVFKGERFGNPKDERHCVNSVSINFSPKGKN